MAYFPNAIQFGDNSSVDANGRLRVGTPETAYFSQFQYTTASVDWTTSIVGSGSVAHLPYESGISLTTAGNTGDRVIKQTKEYLRGYLAKSLTYIFSFNFGTAVTNVRKRVGVFDDFNGFYIEQDGAGVVSLVRRTQTSGSVSEDKTVSAGWNIDKFDGTGASGVTMDWTKVQALSIDYQWPANRIRFGFRVNGRRYHAHQMFITNVLTTPILQTPNLPVRVEIASTAGSVGGTMKFYSIAYGVEGGIQAPGRYFSTGSHMYGVSVAQAGSMVPIVSIRPATTYAGQVNRSVFEIEEMDIMATSNPIYYQVIYSGSLTAASWKTVNLRESTAEMDTSATAISGGIVMESGYLPASNKVSVRGAGNIDSKRYPVCLMDISGTQGVPVTIAACGIGGTATVHGVICWKEFR